MANSKGYFTPIVAAKKPKANARGRIIITIICIFLALVLIVGATVGIVIGVRNAGYLMYLDGVGLDSGVANYFFAYHKLKYMSILNTSGVPVSDTAEFWATKRYGENTYGSDLAYYTENCIKNIIAAVRLFDMYSSLTETDRNNIKSATGERLTFSAGGSVQVFNQKAEAMGFDFSAFERASEMLYKAGVVEGRVFGDGGAAMSVPEYKEYATSLYAQYARVHLVFIRNENKFLTDSEGNIVYETVNEKDKDGNTVTVQRAKLRELTAEEIAKCNEAISLLDACISGINEGRTAPERFFELQELYDEGEEKMRDGGYYFFEDSEYTKEFGFKFPEIVEAAEELEIGKCKKVKTEIGECYIYRSELAEGAYTDNTEGSPFEDFFALATEGFYDNFLTNFAKSVEVRDSYGEKFSLEIPAITNDFIARM